MTDPINRHFENALMAAKTQFRALLTGALALLLVSEAGAHSWQQDSAALGPDHVASVIAELEVLAAAASDTGWTTDGASGDSFNAAVYAFAIQSGHLGSLSSATERVLVTYEALEKGIVTTDGKFADSADVFLWDDYLHLNDIPAIATQRDALAALRAVFIGKGQ
ncbi:MAG: hypothetical protein O2910_00370 [Proteobacteria bacterium]|nr:hypothetical protein [Pseudomonadota bacterium]